MSTAGATNQATHLEMIAKKKKKNVFSTTKRATEGHEDKEGTSTTNMEQTTNIVWGGLYFMILSIKPWNKPCCSGV